MSIVIPKFDRSVVVRGAAAEVVGTQCGARTLAFRVGTRANTSAGIPNGGALSTVHVTVEKCADGARAWARISAERGSVAGNSDRDRTGRGALRILPPVDTHRTRPAASREPARCSGSLRCLLFEQPRMGTGERTGLTTGPIER